MNQLFGLQHRRDRYLGIPRCLSLRLILPQRRVWGTDQLRSRSYKLMRGLTDYESCRSSSCKGVTVLMLKRKNRHHVILFAKSHSAS